MSIRDFLGDLLGNNADEEGNRDYTAVVDPENCDHDFPEWPNEKPYAWRCHLTTPVENPAEDDVQLLATRERGCEKCGMRQNEYSVLADLDISLHEDGSVSSLDMTVTDEQTTEQFRSTLGSDT